MSLSLSFSGLTDSSLIKLAGSLRAATRSSSAGGVPAAPRCAPAAALGSCVLSAAPCQLQPAAPSG
eukprot:5097545-Prymnesium_polylepis.1